MGSFRKSAKQEYDYVVVGAGLYGAIFAHEAHKRGYSVLVVEARNHIGGNCYTVNDSGVNVHMYGPHIFHTNNKEVWDYINRFADFNNFIYRPKVIAPNKKLYSFPINLMTMYQVYGKSSPHSARIALEKDIRPMVKDNLEEWAISQVGTKLYRMFIKGYTQKQWKISPKKLPSSIIKRLPIRYTFDDNYFTDKYQGIPIGGYTQIFEKLLNGIEVVLDTKWESKYEYLAKRKVVYTGPIDAYFDYQFGVLGYRSLFFHHTKIEGDFQGNAVVNYTDSKVPYTRIIEHKHFDNPDNETSIVTTEFPEDWVLGREPYYPINNDENNTTYKRYADYAKSARPNILFGGRLASYKYYDMHQIIGQVLKDVRVEFDQNEVRIES